MLELYNLGITEKDIKYILETNPQIKEISKEEIINLINILKQINCSPDIIKNIIITNPFYLTRIDTDIIELINKLEQLELSNLNYLFDANPYLLNKDAFEIDEFIKEQTKKYYTKDIFNMFESNPYIMDEN